MESIFSNIEAIIPTFLSIMSLVLFTPKTRWYTYSIILLAIAAEFIPAVINTTALFACIACFFGLLLREYIFTQRVTKSAITKQK